MGGIRIVNYGGGAFGGAAMRSRQGNFQVSHLLHLFSPLPQSPFMCTQYSPQYNDAEPGAGTVG